MDNQQQNQQANIIRAKKAQLEKQVAAIRRSGELHIEKVAEEAEQIAGAVQRGLTVNQVDNMNQTLRAMRNALALIEAQEFGDCLDCDRPVPPKRLEAIPWAVRCVSCQERYELALAAGDVEEDAFEGRLLEVA